METKDESETGRAGQAADKLHDALYPDGPAKGARPDLPLTVPNFTQQTITFAREAQRAFDREARMPPNSGGVPPGLPDGDLSLRQALMHLPDPNTEREYFGQRKMPEDFAQVLREAQELLTEEQKARGV